MEHTLPGCTPEDQGEPPGLTGLHWSDGGSSRCLSRELIHTCLLVWDIFNSDLIRRLVGGVWTTISIFDPFMVPHRVHSRQTWPFTSLNSFPLISWIIRLAGVSVSCSLPPPPPIRLWSSWLPVTPPCVSLPKVLFGTVRSDEACADWLSQNRMDDVPLPHSHTRASINVQLQRHHLQAKWIRQAQRAAKFITHHYM